MITVYNDAHLLTHEFETLEQANEFCKTASYGTAVWEVRVDDELLCLWYGGRKFYLAEDV